MSMLKFALSAAVGSLLLAAGSVSVADMPKLGGGDTAAAPSEVHISVLTNTAKGYEIGYPNDWKVVTDADGVDYLFLKTDASAMCGTFSGDMPELAKVTNEQIKAELSTPLGETFWDNVLYGELPNKKYEHTGVDVNHPGGWPVQTALASGDFAFEAGPVPAKIAAIMTFKNAKGYQVMCAVKSQHFDKTKTEIEGVFASFRLLK